MRAVANSLEAAKKMPELFSEDGIGIIQESTEKKVNVDSSTSFPMLSALVQIINMPQFSKPRKRRVNPHKRL